MDFQGGFVRFLFGYFDVFYRSFEMVQRRGDQVQLVGSSGVQRFYLGGAFVRRGVCFRFFFSFRVGQVVFIFQYLYFQYFIDYVYIWVTILLVVDERRGRVGEQREKEFECKGYIMSLFIGIKFIFLKYRKRFGQKNEVVNIEKLLLG